MGYFLLPYPFPLCLNLNLVQCLMATVAAMSVPREASDYDEVSIQQSSLLDDSLKALNVILCLLSIVLFMVTNGYVGSRWFILLIWTENCSRYKLIIYYEKIILGARVRFRVITRVNRLADITVNYQILLSKDLKNLRARVYSAAEYFEVSYATDDQTQIVTATLKDYAIKALVNTVDHLGSVTYVQARRGGDNKVWVSIPQCSAFCKEMV
ncbi:hypothetical protein F3Y22_tig00110319pilonHSYRG00335 [Hibiscus syriacus]|uniref:Uncharacterized protein n=1 Tax=Hibiscus syriacus TaxID=106335 RepID=A0A6A3B533_HIBSY|nr:hypothetical protein F3Y22_tig00110319pilonHSYRG00335 [Hibiscus syriacus]